jgi:hypothetical protein
MHRWVRGAASAIWALVLIVYPLGRFLFDKLAAAFNWWDHPAESAGSLISFLQSLWDVPGLRGAILVLTGFVAGLWLDFLLRKVDGSREEKLRQVGNSMMGLYGSIRMESRRGDKPLDIILRWGGRLNSIGVTLRNHDFLYPRVEDDTLPLLRQYLHVIGALLNDGHIREAREKARNLLQYEPSERSSVVLLDDC